jgi:hypothetical protein
LMKMRSAVLSRFVFSGSGTYGTQLVRYRHTLVTNNKIAEEPLKEIIKTTRKRQDQVVSENLPWPFV